jgi:hypothetical protein
MMQSSKNRDYAVFTGLRGVLKCTGALSGVKEEDL